MKGYLHQIHTLQDSDFPLAVNHGQLRPEDEGFAMHWHENIEMLYITCGVGRVVIDTEVVEAGTGSVVIINSNMLHSVTAVNDSFTFECIIIDKSFCAQNKIDLDNTDFAKVVKDEEFCKRIQLVIQELERRAALYQVAVRAELLNMLVLLCRRYVVERPQESSGLSHKMSIVKPALGYIRQHFTEPITLDQICRHMGVSKGYLCHTFKEVTGSTIVEYINFLRCHYARRLLLSGDHTVVESLEHSGFRDPSYFSQVYKRHMGRSPSQDRKLAQCNIVR